MAMTTNEFDQRMSELLITPEAAPHLAGDSLYNGLQTQGSGTVSKVGFGVSASMAFFEKAKEAGCDAVVTHHGIKVTGNTLDPITYNRFAYLIKNDIALWSAHFVLDTHPTLGNNAQILSTIDATISEPFAGLGGMPWGYVATLNQPRPLFEVTASLEEHLSPNTITYDFGPEEIKTVVAVSGGGAPRTSEDWELLKAHNVDLYITGEVSEWHRELFRESGIHCIAGGHYHTERFGPLALMQHIDQEWGVDTVWIEHENTI